MTDSHRLHETYIEGRGVDPAGAFNVEVVPAPDGVTVVALSGELDMAATPFVRSRVDEAAGTRALVLDLAAVTFVDSSMLKELLRAHSQLSHRGGLLVLAAVQSAVQRLLELTRTSELLHLAATREEALALTGA